jgi:hypothetical protein
MPEVNLDKDFFEALKKVLNALREYNEHFVIVGGLSNALYEYHNMKLKSPLETIATKDIDILVSKKVTIVNEPISKKLIDEGFVVDPKPIESKVITKFKLDGTNFDIEFLCPMEGDGRKVVEEVQPQLTAQALRYLDLALYNPWTVNTDQIPHLEGMGGLEIQLPSPGSYLVQKFIIRNDVNRVRYNQKDAFYTYELLLKFAEKLTVLATSVREIEAYNLLRPKYGKVKTFRKDFEEYYGNKNATGIQKIMKELQKRSINDIAEEDVASLFREFITVLKAH